MRFSDVPVASGFSRELGLGRKITLAVFGVVFLFLPPEGGSHDAFAHENERQPLFIESAESTGLKFTHVNGASGQYYMAEQMGAGVALFDYDNDGDLDVFLVQDGPLDGTTTPRASGPSCRLFRNDLASGGGKRALRFTDVTERAGLALRNYGMGVAVADYDGDGDLDLFVTSFGPDTLFRNNGDGTFTDVTAQAGVSDPLWSTSAAFIDYDRDGDLDLFVANYLDFNLASNKVCHDAVGTRDYCSPRAYHPVPDKLYRNEGNGRFTDVTEASGISKADGAGLGVTTGDYDADGWPDLYVANDATPNQLWVNHHDGTFVDEGMLSGAALNAAGNPEGSMGIASGDFDRDGHEDLFVTNIIGETFALYVSDGKGNFEDARVKAGLAAPTAAFTGFGTDWVDYDNDGWLDLFIANGAVNIIPAQRGEPSPFRMRNQLFHNELGTNPGVRSRAPASAPGRAGTFFTETSALAGPAFERAEIARGAAFGDLDNDGDVDIVVTNNGGPVRLLLNQAHESGSRNHWLEIRAEDGPKNRFGFGAWIGVERAGMPALWRRVRTDGSYLSANDVRVHVGLGAAPEVTAIVVQWLDGTRERWTDIKSDDVVTLRRGSGAR
jgi:enediyne biosynthesis protein E4